VTDAYYLHRGNVSAMEQELRKQGIRYTRRTISKILDMLKLPRVKKPRK
jgi:arginine repressor